MMHYQLPNLRNVSSLKKKRTLTTPAQLTFQSTIFIAVLGIGYKRSCFLYFDQV